jgi:hypothetical protein
MDDLTVLGCVSRLASIGVALRSMEWLCLRHEWAVRGFFDTAASRIQFDDYPERARNLLGRVISPRLFLIAIIIQLLSSMLCLLLPFSSQLFPIVMITATNVVFHLRSRYGLDGSDQMLFLLFPPLMMASAFHMNASITSLTIVLLAAQVCLAYSTAGFAKLSGQTWRCGNALYEILNTRSFGWETAANFMSKNPRLTRGLAIATILIEVIFPLAMITPYPYIAIFLIWGISFHLTNAFVMRLNIFPWAFAASYPAIVYTSELMW